MSGTSMDGVDAAVVEINERASMSYQNIMSHMTMS